MWTSLAFSLLGILVSSAVAAPWVVLDTRSDMLAMSSEVSEVGVTLPAVPTTTTEATKEYTVLPENLLEQVKHDEGDNKDGGVTTMPVQEVDTDVQVTDSSVGSETTVMTLLADDDKEVGEVTTVSPSVPDEPDAIVPVSPRVGKEEIMKSEKKVDVISDELPGKPFGVARPSVVTITKKIHAVIKKQKIANF